MPDRRGAIGVLAFALSLAVAGACASSSGGGAAGGAAATARRSEADLVRLERAWAAAIRARDSTALERLLAPGFVLVPAGAAARPVTRAAWMRNTLRAISIDSIHPSEITVVSRGDSAEVTLWLYWRGRLGGRPVIDESNRLSDLWVRNDGAWKVVRRRTVDRRSTTPPRRSDDAS